MFAVNDDDKEDNILPDFGPGDKAEESGGASLSGERHPVQVLSNK